MADTTNLSQFLSDIADAIRTKKETIEQIPAENFDQEILSIETGIDTSDANAMANDIVINKTAYVNGEKIIGTMPNNGELNYTPSTEEQTIPAGYTSGGTVAGDSNLVANNIRLGTTIFGVEGNLEADKPDQTKTATPTTEEQVITPDTGYELASVTVNAVTSNIDSNIVAENIKKDVSILGITGTYEGSGGGTVVNGIKQFSTIEQMQADSTAKEGDLAVVYRNEVQSATVNSRFQIATFPDTVVLDTAMTDYVEVRYRAVDGSMFDCWGQLDSSSFRMNCYTESGEIRIQYTSSDGITYTRTDSTGNPVDFGTEIYYESAEMWNDVIGKFIQVGGSTFEGLYEYGEQTDKRLARLTKLSDWNITIGDTISAEYNDTPPEENIYADLELICKCHKNYFGCTSNDQTNFSVYSDGKDFYVITMQNSSFSRALMRAIVFDTSGHAIGIAAEAGNFNTSITIDESKSGVFKVDLDNQTLIKQTKYVITDTTHKGSRTLWVNFIPTTTGIYLSYNVNTCKPFIDGSGHSGWLAYVLDTLTGGPFLNIDGVIFYKYNGYGIASTQLTLNNANQLLPGIIGYGKNGLVTGDESIYDNLNSVLVAKSMGVNVSDGKKIQCSGYDSSEVKQEKLYSLSEANKSTIYFPAIRYEIDSSTIVDMLKAIGMNNATTNTHSYNLLQLNNGNILLTACTQVNNTGNTRRAVYGVFDKNGGKLASGELCVHSNTINNTVAKVAVTDDYIYVVYGGAYYSTVTCYVSKFSRYDGTLIKTYSHSTECNFNYTVYVAILNNRLVVYGEDGNYAKKLIIHYYDDGLTSVTTKTYSQSGNYAGSSGPRYATVLNGVLYGIFVTYPKSGYISAIYKFDGTNLITKNISSYGTSGLVSGYLLTDGEYLYMEGNSSNTIKFDKDLNVVATNLQKTTTVDNTMGKMIEFTDYLNYTWKSCFELVTVIDGVATRTKNFITAPYTYNVANLGLNDIRWSKVYYYSNMNYGFSEFIPVCLDNVCTSKNVIATIFTESVNVPILQSYRKYSNVLTSTEYNTAISTANEILGEEV